MKKDMWRIRISFLLIVFFPCTNFSASAFSGDDNISYRSIFHSVGSVNHTILFAPIDPSGLSLSAITSSSIDLTWADNSVDELGFTIERALSFGGPYFVLFVTGSDITFFSDIGLDDNTTYYYRVSSFDGIGSSGYTSASGTTLLDIPGSPSGLSLGGETTSSIDLAWLDNSDNETGFLIERRTTVTSFIQIHASLANVTSYSDTGLEDDTKYYYRVRATNGAGESDYSNVASATTLLESPVDPSNLMLGGITTNSIDLTWLDNSDNETGFQIERSLTFAGGYSLVHTTLATVTSYTNVGLEDNTQYFYRVRAVNAAGPSGYTAVASATTQLAIPSAPSGLSLSNFTHNSIYLSWSDNSDNETGFEIERSFTSGSGFVLIHTTAEGINSYTNTALDEDTEYFYRVRAINAAGFSGYASEANGNTLLLVPIAPSDLFLSNETTNSIDLNWTDNSNNETGFEIDRSLNPLSGYVLIYTTVADITSFSDTGLDDDTQYYYRVRATNLTGPSAYTASSTTATLLAIPSDPDNLEGISTSVCSVDIKWNDNSDNEDGFEIERSLSPTGGFLLIQTLSFDRETYNDPDTENNTTYYYRIRAFNAAGYTNYSAIVPVNVFILLEGGTIAADQTICPSGDPAELSSVLPPTGGGGTWSYQWQLRAIPGIFSNINGAIGLTYDPLPGILQATEYQRVSTTECGIVKSNSIVVSIEDLEPPVFTDCPQDIIAPIERNETNGLVITPDPMVDDNCEVVLLTWTLSGATVASSLNVGLNYLREYTFNQGVTTVSYYAEDNSGNAAWCLYSITVETKIPEVKNVTIPDAPMKIGDIITATIIVGNDGGTPYSLISGAVGSYPLYNPKPFFHRLNDSTYLANFNVLEGGNSYLNFEDIPITNLIVSDGIDNSNSYNLPIVQGNDPLDGAVPEILTMSVLPGVKKIGDVVQLNINADGLNYTIHPSSMMSGILVTEPNIIFSELGGGYYSLNYTVMEGDADVVAGAFSANIILVKPSGNQNLPYSNVIGTSTLELDAHPPVVTRIEVPDDEVGIGGFVQVTITASEEGYTVGSGTVINGVPLSSSRVTFSERGSGLYELAYSVVEADNSVSPGNLEVSIVMIDPAGNTGGPYSVIEPNSLEIYTDLPVALLAGTLDVCEGEEATLTIFLTGRPPWSIVLYDGTATTSYPDIFTSEYSVQVSPTQTTNYTITSVTDVNGVENSGGSSVMVTVNQATNVEIINLATGFSVEADPIELEANIPGGIFSGPGVISSTGYFYPDLADTINSPHIIFYTFINTNGCASIDSAVVFVLGAEGVIYIPNLSVCDYGDSFGINASNIAGVNGSFRLLNEFSTPVVGLTDYGDNTAMIDPSLLSQGSYTVEYQYVDGVVLYLRETFEVESITKPVILNLEEDFYCQNMIPFKLEANAPNVIFEGPGITGNMVDGFIFDPNETEPGEIIIKCTSVSGGGCTASTEKSVNILYTPEVSFTINNACISEEGGMVSFNNFTSGKLFIEIWSWNFGDPSSGSDNYSDLVEPEHYYIDPGESKISLTVTTFEGCVASHSVDIAIGYQPNADFSWISDCYSNGSGTNFINKSISELSEIDTLIWRFQTSTGGVLGQIGGDLSNDTVNFPFASMGSYAVELIVVNSTGCSDTVTKDITLRPTIKLDASGYNENFNTSTGLWINQSEDQTDSWVWDIPDFNGFTQIPDDRSWFTQLPINIIGYIEKSWIQSPCFDFEAIEQPLIQLDYMRSFVPNLNGAVFQYQDVIDEGWKTIGEEASGIDWYNSSLIANKPGGNSSGWGLNVFNPDHEWVTARHNLDELVGKSHVSFRIAIASTGGQGIGNQGFAFDNVIISERTKRTVLEHFTNSSDIPSMSADDLIDSIGMLYSGSVIDLQYHMSYPGEDLMNENNPNPASTRSFYYGIPKIPYTVLDGGVEPDHRFDYSDLKTTPEAGEIKFLSLNAPLFDIDLAVDWSEGSLEATTTVTCATESYVDNIQLYLAVLESSVTAYTGSNGDSQFRNVVLGMLPSPAGKLLGANWSLGKSDSRTNTWSFAPYVEDVEDLAVVAFIQNRNSGSILQSAIEYKSKLVGLGSKPGHIDVLNIYPNPTDSRFYMNVGKRLENDSQIDVFDLSGKLVLTELIPSGYQIYQIDIQHLNRGLYIIQLSEAGTVLGVKKIVKSR